MMTNPRHPCEVCGSTTNVPRYQKRCTRLHCIQTVQRTCPTCSVRFFTIPYKDPLLNRDICDTCRSFNESINNRAFRPEQYDKINENSIHIKVVCTVTKQTHGGFCTPDYCDYEGDERETTEMLIYRFPLYTEISIDRLENIDILIRLYRLDPVPFCGCGHQTIYSCHSIEIIH
jgi:hypothetical protein